MTTLWSASEAEAATGGILSGRPWTATGVSTDSRSVGPGELFVALIGDQFDGHDYVAAALGRGAAAAMVARRPGGVTADAPVLAVADTNAGLARLAGAARARSPAKVVAVTGSVGKTGTKEMLGLVLGRQAETAVSGGNLNNHIGLPLSLARLDPAARYAVFELGMNHPGEIAPLARLARPDVAVITTVTAAHLEFFGSEAAIADEKATILAGLKPGGLAVLPCDNPHFERLAGHARRRGATIVEFGATPAATVQLERMTADPGGSELAVRLHGRSLTYRLGAQGRHWALNSLAVLAAVHGLGADVERAAADLAAVTEPKGRGARRTIAAGFGSFTLIDDSYNASPAAVQAAFSVLGAQAPGAGGRRIAVLGDMRELGPTASALHAALAEPLIASGIDVAFTAGPLMRHLYEALPADRRGSHAETATALVGPLTQALRAGDVVLVKGSLGSRMAPLVAALQALDTGTAGGPH